MLLLSGQMLFAGDPYFHFSLGCEWGSWKPINLQSTGKSSSFKSLNENLYISGFAVAPLSKGLLLRLTVGYFRHHAPEHRYDTIHLFPILFDTKYQLVTESRLSPYVSYGVASCATMPDSGKFAVFNRQTRFGFGLNFGTGFDLLLTKHWAIGCEFRYHYLQFPKTVVITNDFSGPKINFSLYYLFE